MLRKAPASQFQRIAKPRTQGNDILQSTYRTEQSDYTRVKMIDVRFLLSLGRLGVRLTLGLGWHYESESHHREG